MAGFGFQPGTSYHGWLGQPIGAHVKHPGMDGNLRVPGTQNMLTCSVSQVFLNCWRRSSRHSFLNFLAWLDEADSW